MRILSCVLVVVALRLHEGVAAADDLPTRRFEMAASVAGAAPLAYAERGARLSDTTLAVVPIAVDMAYRLAPRVGIAARLLYGIGVPSICHTASDCQSSLGSDVMVVLAARLYFPELGALVPVADVGIGYEWLTTRLFGC